MAMPLPSATAAASAADCAMLGCTRVRSRSFRAPHCPAILFLLLRLEGECGAAKAGTCANVVGIGGDSALRRGLEPWRGGCAQTRWEEQGSWCRASLRSDTQGGVQW